MATFIIQTGKHKGKRLPLKGTELIVGRGEECGIRIASSEVSREHCRLRIDGDDIHVVDLGSQNGTFIDGVPISSETQLPPGSLLHIGPMTFQLADQVSDKQTAREKVASSLTKPKDKPTTDDDIAAWLTEEIPGATHSTADTAIISKKELKSLNDAAALPDTTVVPPIEKREFASIAEEAADIIRRHHESLEEE